jgi:hypothetical protein
MNKNRRKTSVTAELVASISLTLRGTRITPAVAQALAPNLERLNDAALAAAEESDFNDEPARFASSSHSSRRPRRGDE